MARASAALAVVAALAAGVLLVSGGSDADPRTPAGLPGLPAPFLGIAVVGEGGLTAAVDAYGDVVDLRRSPAGAALLAVPAARQAAGTVAPSMAIVPRLRLADGRSLPFWRADTVTQRYLPGTNVLVTVARFGRLRARVAYAAGAAGGRQGRQGRSPSRDWRNAGMRPGERQTKRGKDAGRPNSAAIRPTEDATSRRVRRRQARARVSPIPTSGGGLACVTSVGDGDGAGGGAGVAPQRRPMRPPAPEVLIGAGAAAKAAAARLDCDDATARAAIASAARSDRRWLAASTPLGAEAPAWATAMYRRSLLVLRALTDRRNGAVGAGARDGWAYVWPRDAATAALAFQAAGHGREARRAVRFLAGLDLTAAARFGGDGSPVPGRAAQGDAAGWVAVASTVAGAVDAAPGRREAGGQAKSAGALAPATNPSGPRDGAAPDASADTGQAWRGRADYQEKAPGDYLGNAIAATALDARTERRAAGAAIDRAFDGPEDRRRPGGDPHRAPPGLVRVADDPGSGPDSAAAWSIRPFDLPRLHPEARATLRRLLAHGGRFGIVPSADWPQRDPWTAPTAWSAWAFAALARADARSSRPVPADADHRGALGSRPADLAGADRGAALRLLADLRRAATPAGALPERVDFHTGAPRSTTPLAWSHAFAVLALRELWPPGG